MESCRCHGLRKPGRRRIFWHAVELTNAQLEPDELYLTHLFREVDVILQPDWFTHRVPLPPLQLEKLSVFRPRVADLILTKMARIDEDDLLDIRFLLEREPLSRAELEAAMGRARIPDKG